MGKSQIKTYMPNTESCIQMELNPNLYISNHVPKFQFFLAQVLNLESPIFHYFEHLIYVKTSQWLYHHSIYTNDTTTSWDQNTHTICAMGALENFSFSIVSIRNSRDSTVLVCSLGLHFDSSQISNRIVISICSSLLVLDELIQFFVSQNVSALTLLVGRQEGHPACKELDFGLLVVMIWFWLELCTTYSSSYYHHFHHP